MNSRYIEIGNHVHANIQLKKECQNNMTKEIERELNAVQWMLKRKRKELNYYVEKPTIDHKHSSNTCENYINNKSKQCRRTRNHSRMQTIEATITLTEILVEEALRKQTNGKAPGK